MELYDFRSSLYGGGNYGAADTGSFETAGKLFSFAFVWLCAEELTSKAVVVSRIWTLAAPAPLALLATSTTEGLASTCLATLASRNGFVDNYSPETELSVVATAAVTGC